MIRVVIALEEPLLALGARAAIEGDPGCQVIGVVGQAPEVEATVARLRPDVLLLDARFQAAAERTILSRLAERIPDCRVLVLVDHDDGDCTIRALLAQPREFRLTEEAIGRLKECCLTALRSQARGCIARSAPPELLPKAVRAVAAGDYWTSPGLTAHWIASVRRGLTDAPSGAHLSPRDVEISGLVVEGLANKEIAARLGLSEQTVKNQISRILDKLGLSSRVELALYAVRTRLA